MQTCDETTEPVLCPACEYDVRGLPHSRCPECGRIFTAHELKTPPRPPLVIARYLLLPPLVVSAGWALIAYVEARRPLELARQYLLFVLIAFFTSSIFICRSVTLHFRPRTIVGIAGIVSLSMVCLITQIFMWIWLQFILLGGEFGFPILD